MDIKKYLPESLQIVGAAEADDIRASKALLSAAQKRIDEIRDEIEDRPQRNESDLKKDVVYKLGFIAGLKWVRRLPSEAKAYQQHLPGE